VNDLRWLGAFDEMAQPIQNLFPNWDAEFQAIWPGPHVQFCATQDFDDYVFLFRCHHGNLALEPRLQ
jgi:hypothetical protein